MDENLPRKASHRIPRKPEPVGRVSNPSSTPGQNGVFSDGFLTMTPVDPCHSGQPGETTDPKNPMKSTIDQPSKGSPPSPPSGSFGTNPASLCVCTGYSGTLVSRGVAWLTVLHGQKVGNPLEIGPFSVADWWNLNPGVARPAGRLPRFLGFP